MQKNGRRLKSGLKVMVGIPWLADRDIFSEYLPSAIEHVERAAEYAGVEIEVFKTNPLAGKTPPRGRPIMTAITLKLNEIVEEFMKSGYPFLWIIDADVEVPLHSLKELLLLDADVATGVYLYKNNPEGLVIVGGINYKHTIWHLKLNEVRGKIFGEKEQVQAGNGCLLVRRRVFEKHFPTVPPIRFKAPMGAPGSDILFFREAQALGFKTRLHGGVLCGHLPASPLKRLEAYLEETK